MKENEIKQALAGAIVSGDAEVVGEKKGEPTFKLTESGNARAEELIAEKGLPFLMTLEAKRAIKAGETTTISKMADKIIAKFPFRLKQEAKRNFASFWGEFANGTPEDFIEVVEND